jgi:hypothetical protein
MLERYHDVLASPDFQTFEFASIGPNGYVIKVVRYSEIEVAGYYNLGFGDKNPLTGLLSDIIVTNNGDSQKVLATVAATLYVFTQHYPKATVLAVGSTLARTRLYRMGIANNLEDIEKDFTILGLLEDDWLPFCKGINYEAFLITRKL